MAPPFSVRGATTVEHGSVQLVDIVPDIAASPNMLSEELIFGNTQLSRWHEVEGVPTLTRFGNGVRCQVAREVSEGLEGDVLMGRPSVWQIPLETGLNEGSGEGSVVPVHHQVDGGKCTKGLALVAQDIGGNDSDPEGVEGGGGVVVVTGVRGHVVVVEGEFVAVPKEIEDSRMKVGSSVTVIRSLEFGPSLLEVISEDQVSLV